MTMPKRQTSIVRAAAFACAIALIATGCAATELASNNSTVSVSGNAGKGSGTGEIPATAYLSVVQNYFGASVPARNPGTPRSRYAVTDRQTIARLAALINALPTSPQQNGIVPCPSALSPAYELDFQNAKGDAAPAAEVSIECFGVMVTVHGQREPILSDSASPGAASFLASVASILSRPASGS
jgi:hypothetical protein